MDRAVFRSFAARLHRLAIVDGVGVHNHYRAVGPVLTINRAGAHLDLTLRLFQSAETDR
ncbi:hypothetical protein NSU_4538 [Novosphingobium pentaromativorans US6-1]|uniref:Uncharacterized protein n=1 Tax=Novosphingobium pentaromativorans US6-1 TaxID=1088721 RepID=G6EJL7_9SPHN|nr:hypothetical protein NSU_4538 [Novosphingobium pentaromativorans US6-1]